jgi:hypothetical protein
MDSDETFLSIIDPASTHPHLPAICAWWSKFCGEFKKRDGVTTLIASKVAYYNGTMVRQPEISGPWIGIQFKTKKDKLFFQLKFQQ